MQSKFKRLNQFLSEHQLLWRFEPFYQSMQSEPLSAFHHSKLEHWLAELSVNDIECLKASPSLLIEQISGFIPELNTVLDFIQLPSSAKSAAERNVKLETGIPGRKLVQIQSLGDSVLQQHQGHEWLEWCSGKGYLGRILAYRSGDPVVSFEYQQALCDSGQQEANRLSLPMSFVQGDAFDAMSSKYFHSDQHAVALHACGDLHVQLMHHAANANTRAISFSPCCYHLIHSDTYQAQSTLGQMSELKLTKSELRIPLQETVTGGERVKRHRLQEMSFRLGLDVLLRQELNFIEYCPVPSIKKSQLSEGFESFCLWAAQQKSLDLPQVDFSHYESVGQKRFWQMERLSLVQQAFRRLLEMWLVFDKAMFLQEKGYKVELSEFCAREITPRNILVHAIKVESF